jgi:hypothetical protein
MDDGTGLDGGDHLPGGEIYDGDVIALAVGDIENASGLRRRSQTEASQAKAQQYHDLAQHRPSPFSDYLAEWRSPDQQPDLLHRTHPDSAQKFYPSFITRFTRIFF